MIKKISISLFAIVLLVIAALYLASIKLLEAPINPAWHNNNSEVKTPNSVTVRYSGTATLLFDDGETQWMTDGWFSRPAPWQLLAGTIAPNLNAIEQGLALNEAQQLAAVIPLHSHFDHAMDSPAVAEQTGALLIGSESTANIGRGWGLAEQQIQAVSDREQVSLGKFTITFIETNHFQFPDPELREQALGSPAITQPLTPPVKAFDYRLGKAYALHVSHPQGTWLIIGSAGFIPNLLNDFTADTLFLGIGGLGSQTTQYRDSFWQETVTASKATRIIPIHYDSLIAPINTPLAGPTLLEGFMNEGLEETKTFLLEKEAERPELNFVVLPRFTETVLYP